ncbi:MAG: Npt1/Npt2 family nucleotide transporter [Polyangiales bacterium]
MADSDQGAVVRDRMRSTFQRIVSEGLLVRPGEGKRTALLFTFLLFASAIFVMGRTVRDTLFLSRYSLAALPWMFVFYGIASAITATLYSKVADRLARDRTIIGWCVLGIGSYVATWACVRLEAAWIYPVFYVWAEVFANLLISQFWTLANDLHDARSAKRLFGTIGAARMLGIILVGLGTGAIVRLIGTPQLLFVLATMAAVVAVHAFVLGKEPRPVTAPKLAGRARKPRTPPSLLRDRYLWALSAMFLLTFSALTVGDYQFKAVARATYREDALAQFFSFFYAATGIVSFLFQVFVTPRLLSRFGVGLGMSVMPTVFGAASAMLLGVPTLPIATVMKFADNGFQYSIHETTVQALYVPFAADVKVRTRAFLDAGVKPLAYGVGGLLLLAFASRLGPIHLSYVSVVFVLGWIAAIPLVRKLYLWKLASTLRAGGLAALGDEPIVDAGGKAVLVAALESADPRVVLAALDELGASGEPSVLAALERLASHPDAVIRVAALSRLAPHARATRSPSDDEAISRALHDPVPEVRAAAAEAHAEVHEDEAIDTLVPLLDDPERVVRTSAMAGLLSHGGFEGAMVAGSRLSVLSASNLPEDRCDAAQALGALGRSGAKRLRALLEDPDRRVRLAAVESARDVADPRLVPDLLRLLADPAARNGASAALSAVGNPALEPLAALLAAPETDRDVRLAIPRVLRGIRTRESYATLKASIRDPDSHLRLRIYAAMSRLRESLEGPPEPLADVRALLEREIAETLHVVASWQRAKTELASPLLDEAVDFRALRGLRRVLRILELRYPPEPIRLVRERIEIPARRANALEVLDTTLEPSLRPVVMPFFDDVPVDEKLARAKLPPAPSTADFVREQCRHPNPYVVAILLDALGRHRHVLVRTEAPPLVVHRDPLVREAALVALAATAPELAADAATSLAADPDATVARRARATLAESRHPPITEGPMYSTVEKLLVLRTAPMFEKLRGEDLAPLARVSELETYGPEDTIFEEGDMGDALYVVVRGKVEIRHAGERLASLGAGEAFGEMAVLDASPRSATAVAVEPTEVLRIGSEEFYEVLHEQVEIAEGVIRMLSRRLREANQNVDTDKH